MIGKVRNAAIVATTALVLPSFAAAEGPLLPDLMPLPLERGSNVDLYPDGDQVILDVGFQVANVGAGPLELEPLAEPPPADPLADCDGDGDLANDRPERQNVYLDGDSNGVFDAAADTQIEHRNDGCSIFHLAHNHWHAAVVTTDIYAEATGAHATGLEKVTFCLGDVGIFDDELPGFSPAAVYDFSDCGTTSSQGLSLGWFDRYRVGLAGQQVDVTDLAAGGYCIRQSVDSVNSVDELSEANNVAETRVHLDPAANLIEVLEGPCVYDVGPSGSEPPVIDATAPDTTIESSPAPRLRSRRRRATVQFGFSAAEPDVTFSCSVDGAAFEPCGSPRELRLRARRSRWTRHSFAVRAADSAGNVDSSPAQWAGKVKRRR